MQSSAQANITHASQHIHITTRAAMILTPYLKR